MHGLRILGLTVSTLLAAAGFAFCQTPAQPKQRTEPRNEIVAALKTGRSMVVVVQPRARDESREAYADWAEYLNDFAAQDKSVRIIKLTPWRYSELVTAPKLSRPYNTLFLRDAGHALLYRGMILEPEIYRIGKAYMTAKPADQSVHREGLEEVKLEIRP
jgi:hypothetical protein